ncbi:MAG: hypothetical protein JNK60_11230 [Acidobacteria bacterium]|nr:hypothetical protein [Acidobacteriota bacterium]
MSDEGTNEKPSAPEATPEGTSRREFLVERVGLGALAGVGALAAGQAALAQPVPDRQAAALASFGKRVVTLTVKLPDNVDLKTQIERVPGKALALELPEAGQDQRRLVMDLTSSKAQDWLKPKKGSFSVSGSNCCCVRG